MIKPINDYILLKELKQVKEQREGSVIISVTNENDDTASRLRRFEVLAVSNGYTNPYTDTEYHINKDIKVGSTIIMDKFSGKKVLDNGTEYVLAKEAEIVGIEE